MSRITLYDTTLRDGRQGAGIAFSLLDLLCIVRRLDALGVDYIEAGWPGSNPRDIEFFEALKGESLRHAKIVAFGSTRHAKNSVHTDPVLQSLAASGTKVVTIFGKSWDLHVREVFGISENQNLDMIRESVAWLKEQGREVIYDAEHFFDGYIENPDFAMRTLRAAADGGADSISLCETNGGLLPFQVEEITRHVVGEFKLPIGIHCHNDSGCGVANTLAAVRAGASLVQGTINGFGERCGNADLITIIADLSLKMGYDVLTSPARLADLSDVSRLVSELANMPHDPGFPYVGANAFAHKAGVHVNAVQKVARSYEHCRPELIGNSQRILISDYSGRSSVIAKAREFNLDLEQKDLPQQIIDLVKRLENDGFQFEGADASFELLIRQAMGQFSPGFELKGFRIITHKVENNASVNEATIKVVVNGVEEMAVAEGDGPVNALDQALRKVLERFYPVLKDMSLVDYKVRILNGSAATAARTRVLIESKYGDEVWGTVGVSENIIEASWQALVDSIEYLLMKHSLPQAAKPGAAAGREAPG
jgi:2-isopropylmalate synthase